MDKIFIKPDSKEIIFRGKPEDGHADVFSYNYEGNAANGLGGLFIVGHVQPATEDTSYMVNLVASLAKREYYAKADADPKDSFSKTLKKINEVLQDFFHNKETKVNIGIFAVAGENILISRLGKFKIILSRNGQDIDILNNINLFSKEHIQEKEFSNIISGKVMPQDKIFAFYPAKSVVAREKNIKSFFVKLAAEEFSNKLSEIKNDSDSFMCAGVHLTINKYAEPTIESRPQPRELRPEKPIATLTKTTKPAKEKPVVAERDLPTVRPVETPKIVPVEPPPTIKIEPAPAPKTIETKIDQTDSESRVFYPDNKGLAQDFSPKPIPNRQEESPLIRPSEFSSAKKDNFLSIILKKYKPSGVYVIGHRELITKKQIIWTTSLVAVIAGAAILVKLTFMPSLPIPGIESEQDKALNALHEQINVKFELAKTYKDQNNLFEARRTLIDSLLSFGSSYTQNEDLQAAKTEITALLDQIDNAVDSSPSLFKEIVQDTNDNFQLWSAVWSLVNANMKASQPELAETIDYYPYQDNLYILASDGIYKITDGLKGKGSAVSWLNKDVILPVNPISFAIDSKVFVVTKNGILATFYKGDKVAEINIAIPIDKGAALLTTQKSTLLYLVDKSLGRIYVLTKDAGVLVKTLKLNSEQPILNASIGDDEAIYLLTSDKKVWKVVP